MRRGMSPTFRETVPGHKTVPRHKLKAAVAAMTPHPAIRRRTALAALLCGGAIVPVKGWTHWEGFEAADPSTPAALLRFESAAADYVETAIAPESWLARFGVDGRSAESGPSPVAEAGAGDHSGHTGVEQSTPAPMPE